MPEDLRRANVVVIPPPTVNGPLHVGHLSGPFLAADFAARAARARGAEVLAVTGLDVHQNYVLTRAENEGIDVEAMIDRYHADIVRALDRARIGYDLFVDPREPGYGPAIADLMADLVTRASVPVREFEWHRCAGCARTLHHSYVMGTCVSCGCRASGGSCEGCGGFTSAQTMPDARCARCGGNSRPFVTSVPVLALEDHRAQLEALWVRAEFPAAVRDLIADNLERGLPEIPLAYPTNWGVEGAGDLAGLRLDVYAELGLSLLRGVARTLDPDTPDGVEAYADTWRRRVGGLWTFHGIDNAFYCALMWPALLAAAGVELGHLSGGAVINRFYTLDGLKFSTSRGHAIWANELLAAEDPAIVRLYLAWNRPDRFGSDFTRDSFEAFADHVRPLLAGKADRSGGLPAPLLDVEHRRGERALDFIGFDPPLAARSLLTLLAAGHEEAEPLRGALTGEPAGGAR
jgi:methionyl-tRNA synthetase